MKAGWVFWVAPSIVSAGHVGRWTVDKADREFECFFGDTIVGVLHGFGSRVGPRSLLLFLSLYAFSDRIVGSHRWWVVQCFLVVFLAGRHMSKVTGQIEVTSAPFLPHLSSFPPHVQSFKYNKTSPVCYLSARMSSVVLLDVKGLQAPQLFQHPGIDQCCQVTQIVDS